jgi:signal transduction histidine kinase
MTTSTVVPSARAPAPLLGWPRLRVTLIISLLLGLLIGLGSVTPMLVWLIRALVVGGVAMLAFGLVERRPRRLPRWIARWALQLLAIALSVPVAAYLAYWLTTGGAPQFVAYPNRFVGFGQLVFAGVLFGIGVGFAAIVREREARAHEQAAAFELERSELARQALDTRLRLLQAQVQPHFLFNTLANVKALVDSGSPQASPVLASLIAYLRAAVPQLHDPATTIGQELQLVRAYLELMHMRMPDRLQVSVQADAEALAAQCPPMALLTLVENAVRHGIDPSEDGGRIDVEVRAIEGRCRIQVRDTGVGLAQSAGGAGTGLSTLRERLQLAYGDQARLRLMANEPHGVTAELELPLRSSAAGRAP